MSKTAAKKLAAEEQAKIAEAATRSTHAAEAVNAIDEAPAPETPATGGAVETEGKLPAAGVRAAPDAAPAVTPAGVSAGNEDAHKIKEAAAKEAAAKEAAAKEAAAKSFAAAAAVAKARLVRVRVIGQPVAEEHGRYEKGDEFTTTLARAEALGSLVTTISFADRD